MLSKNYYVYILTNKINTALYIGVTDNIKRRVYEHKSKVVPGFTSRYNLTKLVYYEIFEDPLSAITREKQLKGWIRIKKENLIYSFNPEWEDLYEELI